LGVDKYKFVLVPNPSLSFEMELINPEPQALQTLYAMLCYAMLCSLSETFRNLQEPLGLGFRV